MAFMPSFAHLRERRLRLPNGSGKHDPSLRMDTGAERVGGDDRNGPTTRPPKPAAPARAKTIIREVVGPEQASEAGRQARGTGEHGYQAKRKWTSWSRCTLT